MKTSEYAELIANLQRLGHAVNGLAEQAECLNLTSDEQLEDEASRVEAAIHMLSVFAGAVLPDAVKVVEQQFKAAIQAKYKDV